MLTILSRCCIKLILMKVQGDQAMDVLKAVCFAFAALSMVGSALAQAPTDYSKVEIKTDKIAPNFYVLNGSGGAIGVLAGPDGVLMVDSQFAPLTEKIVAAVKQISNGPIR